MKKLVKFCRESEVDEYEIDSTLTYDENMKHLSGMVPTSEDILMKQGRVFDDMDKSLGLADRYGWSEQDISILADVRLRVKSVFQVERKSRDVLAFYGDLCARCRFVKRCASRVLIDMTDERKNILKVTGNVLTTAIAQIRLSDHNVRHRLLRRVVKHKHFQYVGGFGWAKNPNRVPLVATPYRLYEHEVPEF